MTKLSAALVFAVLLVGCSSPREMTDAKMARYSPTTMYVVEDSPDGFTATVRRREYQFVPSETEFIKRTREELLEIVSAEASSRGREIATITDDDIDESLGRNYIMGVWFCMMQARARYADEPAAAVAE